MLNVLRAALRMGRVTTKFPDVFEPASPGYRGRPELDPVRCMCSAACVAACPAKAITLEQTPDGPLWQLDLGRCVFCGLCAEACPEGAIEMTTDYLLAARHPWELLQREFPGTKSADSRPPDVQQRQLQSDGDRLGHRIRTLLGRSLHIRHMDAGSDNACDWEIAGLLGPVYDVQRLGIDFVASPRHADLLLVTGAVTRHLEPALLATYEAMPSPKLVVAVGDEACGGGVLQGSYAIAGGVDRCLPVDVYIPGSPPKPQALIQGLLMAVGRDRHW